MCVCVGVGVGGDVSVVMLKVHDSFRGTILT